MKIIMLMAVTADGIIARDATQLVDWTGKADKKYFVEVTRSAGVMIMGSKTFDTIGKALPGRLNIVMSRDKTRQSNQENLVYTDQPPDRIIADLKEKGYENATLIGGAEINSLFIKKGLVDEVHLTVVPRFFGKGMPLFNFDMDLELELLGAIEIGQSHILLRYGIPKQA